MAARAITGRDVELAALKTFLDQAVEGPAGLVVSGDAGIGKTILWEAAVEDAHGRFDRVLACRAAEAEASLSYAGLSDLLGDALEDFLPSLAAPRRRALEVALLLAEPGEEPLNPHAVGLAVRDVLDLLGRSGPLLVALDDVQWIDPASAGVLQVALRRLPHAPIGVLLTARGTDSSSIPLGLEQSLSEERLTTLSLGPLSLGALRHLLAERLDLSLTRSELSRVQQTSGGNPFFALELARELARQQVRPAAGQRLRIPAGLNDAVGGRLGRLPEEATDVLLAVAALARPTVDLVAAANGDTDRVRAALSAAVADEIVELEDSRVRFTHPLLASICYERAPVWKRREVHGTLADVVTDVEERARHLALATERPDAAVASELDHAAENADARGATAAAAELCELAAGLTPRGSSASRRRFARAARYHHLAGDLERAAALLRELLPEVSPGIERADVLYELLNSMIGDRRMRRELFDAAVAEAAGDDVRLARILNLRAGFQLWDGDVSTGLATARSALEGAERSGDETLLAATIARVGQLEPYVGAITPGLLERGAEIERRVGLTFDYWASPTYGLARLLIRLGDLDRSRRLLEQLEDSAAAHGDEVTTVMVLWALSMLEWLAGRWPRALDHAVAAYELGEQIQHPHGRLWVGRMKALVEADLGLVEQARASAEEGLRHSRVSNEFAAIAAKGVLGRIELMLGNVTGAAGYLHELPGRLLAAGLNEPTTPVWADAIETLIAAGDLERARVSLGPYEVNSRRVGSRWAMAGVARCRGLLAAAEGDVDGGLETLELASAENSLAAYPLERGRTLLTLGTLRRQALQKKAAREALGQAIGVFEELGARLWADRARAEVGRVSGRRVSGDELTETERRVAAMAAEGLTNKQIASALFMGVSTVEAHLSHVYRKLGIRSRAGISGRLGSAANDHAKSVDEATQS